MGHDPSYADGAPPAARRPSRSKRPSSLFDPETGLLAERAAKRLADAGPLRWGTDGAWWTYDSGVWVPGEDVVHARVCSMLGDRFRPAHAKTITEFARSLVGRIEAAPTPDVINFRNGLLYWRPGRFVPHDPDVLSTIQLNTEWATDAKCPTFDAFLSDVIEPDDIQRVWEIIGYMLMSGNPLHRAFLFAGSGRNGKGALMRTILHILGPGNVSNVPLHDLSSNRFATAQLYGRAANICGDIDSTYLENTGRLKEITGEDPVQAEHKFGQPFRFTAWCSMLFSANSIPGAADSSVGWLRRWEIVPFNRSVVGREDRTLEPRLRAEAPGICLRAVRALVQVMDRGDFTHGESSDAARQEFAERSNPARAWLAERCYVEPAGWTKATAAYDSFKFWLEDGGRRTMARSAFYEKVRQIEDAGISWVKRDGINGFKGFVIG